MIANPRLRPSVEPFLASTGDLYLIRTDGGGDAVMRAAPPLARGLIDALRSGGASAAALTRQLAAVASESEVATALGELEAAGLLTDSPRPECLGGEAAARYDRQLHYFADQAAGGRSAEAMQQALIDATVVVLGAGGLGCWAMSGLVCAGVGRIVAVDHDRVEVGNLNRQILYRTPDLGRLKVEVAGEALQALNPALDYRGVPLRLGGPADVRSLIRGADFVVCTADSPIHLIGRWVNEACVSAGIAHISAGQFPPRIRVGPTFVPGLTGCLDCQERGFRAAFPLYDELVGKRQAEAPVAATLGAASGLIGSLIAMDVVHWLTGICAPATLGRGLVFDLRDFSSRWDRVAADPDCRCQRAASACRPRGTRPA